MAYKLTKIRVEETNSYDIARALAYLAGFREHKVVKRTSSDRSRSILVFYKDTIERDPDLYRATQSPDILVSKVLGEEYVVEFNERVDESLVGRVKEEIRLAYSQR